MLDEILAHLRNYFCVEVLTGTFEVSDGGFAPPSAAPGQYFRIVGSVFNDGVYQSPASDLTDETFGGEVWLLAVPPALLALSADIQTWAAAHPETPYTSESFGGYYYTKASGKGGQPAGWQEVFRSRLNRWRKT